MKADVYQPPAEQDAEGDRGVARDFVSGGGLFFFFLSLSSSLFLVFCVIVFRLNAIFSRRNLIPLPALSCFHQQ